MKPVGKYIHFCGGGFKTIYYLKIIQVLIKKRTMPKFYSGTSCGAMFAALCLALSTKKRSKRQYFFNYAKKRIIHNIVRATAHPLKNWHKISTTVNVVVEICKYIQPDISRYNYLSVSMVELRYSSIRKLVATRWATWDDLKIDLRAGASIPLVQDNALRRHSGGYFAIDGNFMPEHIPKNAFVVACSHTSEIAHWKPPVDNSPKWWHLLYNPSTDTINEWLS